MAEFDEKAVFNAARRIGDAAARDGYLRSACGADAEALRRIRELLRVHDQAQSFLESPAVPFAPGPERPLEAAGTVIGPYKLLEQIGEGGFGVVFLAEQTHPVRRKVALKVIKPGMDTRQVMARFEAERQALALMEHPNIAKVLDAGATETGRPYFVMELVRGYPITEYCDAHHLTPRERLELFVTVCHAIQHAHQKGVIHRDVKPSNVLVTLHDDRPVAKVIDFGIAKATGGQLTDRTLFTGFAQWIGTPLYMSPEQASMSAVDVDTRSDVYSLGVLLYELLTGTTPFGQARLKEAAFDEVRRIIREEEPGKPSARLSSAETLATVAANRGMEPAKLTRLVRGELDWIAMKALEKDRSRRYATANGLAMDVQRYLADEEVSACPPSMGYRMRKLVRRNRRALASAALLAALLVVVAATARERAVQRGRNAEAVAALLGQSEEDLKADAVDRAAIALEAAERRAADSGAEALEDRLARCRADLALLRELDAVDAFVYGGVRPPAGARAARWRAALAGYGVAPEHSGDGEAKRRVAESLVRDRVLNALDRWLVAEPSAGVRALLREADPDPYRDAVRDAVAAHDTPAVIALGERPEALAQPARFAAVLGLLPVPLDRRRAALEAALRSRPGDLGLLMALGMSYRMTSEWIRWQQAAVAAHPGSAAAHLTLGAALAARGDWNAAIRCYEEAIRIAPDCAQARTSLGALYHDKGDLKRAIACHEEAVRLDPASAVAHASLGGALAAHGDLDRAISHLEKAVALDPNESGAHGNLGNALAARGDSGRAVGCYKEAIRLDPTDAVPHFNLGVALAHTGDSDGAIAQYREAIGLKPAYGEAYYNLGNELSRRDLAEAVAAYHKAIELKPDHAEARCNLGAALMHLGRFAEAVDSLRKGHEIGRRRPNWPHPSDRWVQEAERLVALEERLPNVVAGGPAVPDDQARLADMCLRFKKRYADAALLFARAFEADPRLVAEPNGHRYNAACAAALAAAGQGVGTEGLGSSDEARLRGMALEWLRAELTANREVPAGDRAAGQVHERLGHWLNDPDLSGVRDAEALAGLPPDERERWTEFWSDVRGLMARATK